MSTRKEQRDPTPAPLEATHALSGMTPNESGSARLFVSSTFADLHEERDVLTRTVFPGIELLCASRGITWSEIDLRWGLDDEAVAEKRAITLCMEEIDAARPLFIAILAGRYGWVAEGLPPELVKTHPWLRNHPSKSITELEIRHGCLNAPENSVAFVYIRDPDTVEGPASEEDPRLASLKAEIRASPVPVRSYGSPRELAALVKEDLEGAIDRLHPPGATLDGYGAEARRQRAFSEVRARRGVESPAVDELRRTADQRSGGYLFTGTSGCGKSSAVALWERAVQGPTQAPSRGGLLRRLVARPKTPKRHFFFYVEATDSSRDWLVLARHMTQRLSAAAGTPIDPGSSPPEARRALAQALALLGAAGPAVIVVDGVDHLADLDQGRGLSWVPDPLPPGITLVLTGSPELHDTLGARGYSITPLPIPEPPTRAEIARRYLARYGKTLPDETLAELAAGKSELRHLTVLLHELRLHGSHKTLHDQLLSLSASPTTPALLGRVLTRLESDFAPLADRVVGRALGAIAVSRRGLHENEIRAICGSGADPLPASIWVSLRDALDPLLDRYDGTVSLSGTEVRSLIEERYLQPSPVQARTAVADYFERAPIGPRRIEEGLFQLRCLSDIEGVHRTLTDLDLLEVAWSIAPLDVLAYWSWLETQGGFSAAESYLPLLDHLTTPVPHLLAVAQLLRRTGHTHDSLSLGEAIVKRASEPTLSEWLDAGLRFLALTLRDAHRFEESHDHLVQRETLARAREDGPAIAECLGSRCIVLTDLGRYDAALSAVEEQREVLARLGDEEGLTRSLGFRGRLRLEIGDLRGARSDLEAQAKGARANGDLAGLMVASANLGVLAGDAGRLGDALRLLDEAQTIARTFGDWAALASLQVPHAQYLSEDGDFDSALTMLEEQETLAEALGDPHLLSLGLMARAALFANAGDTQGAEHFIAKALELCSEYDLPREREGLEKLRRDHLWNRGQFTTWQNEPL